MFVVRWYLFNHDVCCREVSVVGRRCLLGSRCPLSVSYLHKACLKVLFIRSS